MYAAQVGSFALVKRGALWAGVRPHAGDAPAGAFEAAGVALAASIGPGAADGSWDRLAETFAPTTNAEDITIRTPIPIAVTTARRWLYDTNRTTPKGYITHFEA